ncbi:MAG: hypothetical protein WC505_03860 [Patescibacteria group bacterium]
MANKNTISPIARELSEVFRAQRGVESIRATVDEPKLKVDETVGKVAYVYEKVRVAIDYQEEHLIRKNAIARMLKRRITMRERGRNIAAPLLRELIRAGYLKNNYFPESRIPDIERMVAKYVRLIDIAASRNPNLKERNRTIKWITQVASAEIEAYLSPTIKDDALVEAMYKTIRSQIDLTEQMRAVEDQDIQVYIAIHRALVKSDHAILRYHLTYYYAPWWRYATDEEIEAFAVQLPRLMRKIELQISNKLSDRLFRYAKKFAPLFLIFKDILNERAADYEALLADPNQLESAIRKTCDKRYTESSTKLSRGVFRSIIYIFFTKTIMAFALELPYEAIFLSQIKLLPLAINVVFHPFLMFIIATSIRVPAEENTRKIFQGISEIVYDPDEKVLLKQRERTFRTSRALNAVFSLLYAAAFIITFGGIIWLLRVLDFSSVSSFLFVFFLSVISFFALHLRNNAKELVMVSKRDSALMAVIDFFALPVLRAGRWISSKTSKVNIFMFIMDFVIEAPFKVLIETVEDWLAFQRQKKEEIM